MDSWDSLTLNALAATRATWSFLFSGVVLTMGGLILLGAEFADIPANLYPARHGWREEALALEGKARRSAPIQQRAMRSLANSAELSYGRQGPRALSTTEAHVSVRNDPIEGWIVRAHLMAMATTQRSLGVRQCPCGPADRLSR